MIDFIPLNPADHVLLALDREIRAAGLPGAWCGFALELAGRPDARRLQDSLAALASAFPTLTARLVQRGRRYGWQPTGSPVPLTYHPLPPGQRAAAFWHSHLLALMHDARDSPLSWHWIEGQDRTLILVRWLHPLMDASGVQRMIDFLMADEHQRRRYRQGEVALVAQKLAAWSLGRKLRLLWRGKRHNDWIDQLASSLPAPPLQPGTSRKLSVVNLVLSADQTQALIETTRRRVGLGAQSLYLIGCLMRALEAMEPALRKDAWCIPYAFNLRQGNAPVPVTGNQVSVLFAQAPHPVVANRNRLFSHLRAQYANAVRQELDQAYLPLMWLGRWLSLERYGDILCRQKSGGERSSVWFSDVGEIRFLHPDFFGAPIEGIRHACFMPAPPALAVLFSRFRGRLNAAINYLEPDFDRTWIERFQEHLQAELLAD